VIQCLSAAMGLGLSTWMLGIYAQAARSSGSSCHSSAGCGLVRRAAESTLGGALCAFLRLACSHSRCYLQRSFA
jgi:hypothetical protein